MSFFGVSTGLVTYIPLKMCHVFVGSGRRLRCLGEKGCRGGLGGPKEGKAGRPGWRGWGLGREAACEREGRGEGLGVGRLGGGLGSGAAVGGGCRALQRAGGGQGGRTRRFRAKRPWGTRGGEGGGWGVVRWGALGGMNMVGGVGT